MTERDEVAARRRVGTTLCKRYRLDELVGVGGMAAVYRGVHTRNRNRVAIKVLHPEVSLNADACARFLSEGYIANSVGHPGAVRVLDDDTTEDGAAFIVMELLEGETVDALHARSGNRLPPGDVAQLAHQALDVLRAAHAAGIVHRDIKPENLFLTRDGRLKVLDFGIARMREANGSLSRTGSGMPGTPAFMPREQAMALTKEIDGRTDLWSVGATMFALVSGRYVHEAETMQAMMVMTATRPARSLAVVAPETPAWLVAIVDRALAFEKENRFADAAQMQEALAAGYLAAFGRAIDAPLSASAFVSERARPRAPIAVTVDDPDLAPSVPPASFAATVPAGPASAPGETLIPMRATTTVGVASESPREQPAPRRGARAFFFVAAATGAVTLTVAGAWIARARNHDDAPRAAASAPSATQSVAVAPPPATTTPQKEIAPAPPPVDSVAQKPVRPSAAVAIKKADAPLPSAPSAAPSPPVPPIPTPAATDAGCRLIRDIDPNTREPIFRRQCPP
jgi:serine/threonine-protein kinase